MARHRFSASIVVVDEKPPGCLRKTGFWLCRIDVLLFCWLNPTLRLIKLNPLPRREAPGLWLLDFSLALARTKRRAGSY